MNALKLNVEECSPFGQLVLQYLEKNPETNMSDLAKEIGISRAGLGWICRRESNPDEETALKLAHSIGANFTDVARLVHENKLEKLAQRKRLIYATKFSKESYQTAIPLEDAIAGLNALFQAFHTVTQSVPTLEKPNDYQIYKQAYEIIKREFLSRKIPRKLQESRKEPSPS